MKLNPDCMRAVLLYIEETQIMDSEGYIKPLISGQIANAISEFDNADILYSIKHLCESGYIDGNVMKTDYFICHIFDITPLGHEFIENIKDDTVWGSTKECAKRIGSFSLNVISQISAAILTAAIQAKLTV